MTLYGEGFVVDRMLTLTPRTTFVNGVNPFRQAPLPQPELYPSEMQRVAAALKDGPKTARQLMARLDITNAASMGGYLSALNKHGAVALAPRVEGLPPRRYMLVDIDKVPPDTVRRVVSWLADNPHRSKTQICKGLGISNANVTELLQQAAARGWVKSYDVHTTRYYTAT